MFPENHTLIGTLRIKGATDSTPALRLSLSSMLGSADLRPNGISPSAILVVRNLADPLPAHLKPQGVTVDTEWERAVQDSLTRIYHQAARPVHGYIPPDAKAALFADEGELLACLALDVSRGETAGRWWWKEIVKRSPSSGLQNLLCGKADYVPAVLHHLAEWGQAVTVVSALSREEVKTVISALNRVYGLQEPECERTDASPLMRSNRTQEVEPPWKRWLLSAPQQLSKEKEYLLGLGLSIYHEPASVKTRAFLRDLRTWLVYRDSTSALRYHFPEDQPSPIRITGADRKDAAVRKMEREKTDIPTRSAAKELDKVTPPSSFQGEGMDEQGYQDTAGYIPHDAKERPVESIETIRNRSDDVKERSVESVEPIGKRTEADLPGKVVAGLEKEPHIKPESAGTETIRNRSDDVKERSVESVEPIGKRTETDLPGKVVAGLEKEPHLKPESAGTIPEEGVFTQLGGVLYLINLMRHLDLPACFEEEWGLASQLGSWGTLEVLACVLAGEDDLSHDPLWNVLAELGGRDPGELPGEIFCGSESFHLPASWFNSDELTYFWAADRQRLRLWSENYMLVDCPGDESAPLMQARNELDRYLDNGDSIELSGRPFDDAPVETVNAPGGLNPELARWLSMVMPYIRYRLRSALGPGTSEYPERAILHVQGRLYVTSTHVDLVMSMDDISIPVRLAGLDRDPGWLPEFGRVVLFHFE